MGKDREKTSGSQRALALVSVFLLSEAATVAFGRLFSASQAKAHLLLATAAAVVLAVLTERRHLVLAGGLSAAGLLVALGLLVFPGTLWHGAPTPHTLSAIADAVRQVGLQARTQVAPTPSLTPLMLAAISAVWAAAFASHALATRAGSPLLALLPPLALFTFADAVRAEGSRPAYTVLLLIGILSVIFADGIRRVRQWGPVEIWRSSASNRRPRITAGTRGAPSVAALVIGIAVLAPGLLPGWGSEAALEPVEAFGTGVDPMVSLRADLDMSPERPLFEVTASSPSYWRLLSLDRFDGVDWSASALATSTARDIGSGGSIGAVPESGTLHQGFRVQDLSSPWLPMAFRPVSITLPDGELKYVDDLAIALPTDPISTGSVYQVESSIVSPTPAELDSAYDPTVSSMPTINPILPEGFLERYTQLPASTPTVVRETALRITDGASDEYRKMLAIQSYLRKFTYTEDVTVPLRANPLSWFLTESRAGFCQQFSGAMAAMARSLGYPARVAVGFTPGEQRGDDHWQVSTGDAHAWPEIYFVGIGWVAFEPTPGKYNPAARTYLVDPQSLPRGSGTANAQGDRKPSTDPSLPADFLRRRGSRVEGLSSRLDGRSPFRYWWTALAALLSVLLAALLSVPMIKTVRRRYMLRSAKGPRDLVLAGYRVFEEKATDAGFARAPGQTLGEYRDALHQQVAFSEDHFDRLVATAIRAAYSGAETDAAEASKAIEDERVAAWELLGNASLARRVRGAYRVGWGARFRS